MAKIEKMLKASSSSEIMHGNPGPCDEDLETALGIFGMDLEGDSDYEFDMESDDD